MKVDSSLRKKKRVLATKKLVVAKDLMKAVELDVMSIEYLNSIRQHGRMPISRFGIRVSKDQFWAIIKVGTEEPHVFGKAHSIPIDRKTLPHFVIAIINDHMREHPTDPSLDVPAFDRLCKQ